MVDTKRGYVGRYEERLARQESERRYQTVLRMFPGFYYTRCALIRTDGRLYTLLLLVLLCFITQVVEARGEERQKRSEVHI